MAYAIAKTMPPDAIPIIDLGPIRDGSDMQSVANSLHKASQSLGFIYVKNHGIDPSLIEAARQHAFKFFRGAEQQKAAVKVSPSHRGWLKPGASKMDDKARADLKESFLWAHENSDGNQLKDHPFRGPNQWPPNVPELKSVAMDYFKQAHEVASVLMRGFALGLKLDEQFFLKTSDRPLSRASFVYYPAQDEALGQEQFGVAPHTDFGVLTVLCQDNTGGLQVQNINGDWIHAPPIEGTLVVNVADLLSRWTAGAYKSTPHRVVNSSGKERLSLVLAYDPNPETKIDANEIPGLVATDDLITCGDYLLWRFEKAFSYRNKSS